MKKRQGSIRGRFMVALLTTLFLVGAYYTWLMYDPYARKGGDIFHPRAEVTSPNLIQKQPPVTKEIVEQQVSTSTPKPQIVSSELIKTKVDTSTWNTYRSEKYGFQFKYPPGFRVFDDIAEEAFFVTSSSVVGRSEPFASIDGAIVDIYDQIEDIEHEMNVLGSKVEFSHNGYKIVMISSGSINDGVIRVFIYPPGWKVVKIISGGYIDQKPSLALPTIVGIYTTFQVTADQ